MWKGYQLLATCLQNPEWCGGKQFSFFCLQLLPIIRVDYLPLFVNFQNGHIATVYVLYEILVQFFKKIPKITETLKMKIFCRKFSNIFLLLKQTIAKQKLKNLFFKTLFWAPKMGKGKANFLEFLFICWLKKSKNTFSPEAGVKSIDKTKIQYEALLRPCSKLKSNPKAKF